ncbi:hypothetical protein ACFX10_027915 [Malus domestica]
MGTVLGMARSGLKGSGLKIGCHKLKSSSSSDCMAVELLNSSQSSELFGAESVAAGSRLVREKIGGLLVAWGFADEEIDGTGAVVRKSLVWKQWGEMGGDGEWWWCWREKLGAKVMRNMVVMWDGCAAGGRSLG